MSRLREKYVKEVIPSLIKEFDYKNIMEAPKLTRVALNMGLGEAIHNIKILDSAVEELALIAAQRPVITRAKRSIASFKVREGMPIGCMVTLRRERMYYFLDKLFNIDLPRVRDFRGLSDKSFDGRGNYSLGIKEHIIFPEIDYDKIDKVKGLNITIVTTAKTDIEARFLLEKLGMPFRT
jgi:large subunit ribosomal protein L5